MTPSPILKVLSSMRKHRVKCLLMGGQACVLYGAAEFSRDTDLAVLADPANLSRMRTALRDLQAASIAVPPLCIEYLNMGLAAHFRCKRADVLNMRIDIMSKLRGVAAFEQLWQRRTTIEYDDEYLDVMALPDLVRAKKTQRDKDWPMIRRLVEANYFQNRDRGTRERVEFWLAELRTAALLIDVARQFSDECHRMVESRQLLRRAVSGDEAKLESELADERQREMAADRSYWRPLTEELGRLRRMARSQKGE